MTAGVAVVDRRTASRGIRALFTEDGVSTVAGRAVLLPRAALSDDTVEEATSAGALSVLVDGPLPAGAFSLDVPAGVPVVGLASDVVAEIRAMLAAGIPVTVAIGNVEVASREAEGSIAAFSSRGLVLDGSLEARPRGARSLRADVRARSRRRRRGAVRDDQRDERRRSGDRGSRGGRRTGTAGARRAPAPRRARRLGARGRTSTRRRPAPASSTCARRCSRSSSPSRRCSRSAPSQARSAPSARSGSPTSRRGASPVSVGHLGDRAEGSRDRRRSAALPAPAGRSAVVVVSANTTSLSSEAGVATGELVLRGSDTPEVHVPWTVAVPPAVDLVSRVRLRDDGDARLGRDSRGALVRRGLGDGRAGSAGARDRAARGRAPRGTVS